MRYITIESSRFLALLGTLLVVLTCTTARADESPGITVSATGVAEAMPDVVELAATVVGNAELAGDAVEKYRGNKRRIVDALGALGIKGLTVTGSGLSVNSGAPVNPLAALQGAQANQAKVADKLAVQERLTVTVPGVNAMSGDELLPIVTRIVDVAKDAGVDIGPDPKGLLEVQFSGAKPSALVTFKLSDVEPLRQQAYEAALKQARAKAEQLAKLAGVELGDVASIRETAPIPKEGDNSGGGFAAYVALFSGASGAQAEHTAAELRSIPVTVSLTVRFDIAAKK